MTTSGSVRVIASSKKLPGNVPSLGADRFADSNFARSLGDAHQHDIHDANTAHQQPIELSTTSPSAFANNIVKFLDLLLGSGNEKLSLPPKGTFRRRSSTFADWSTAWSSI